MENTTLFFAMAVPAVLFAGISKGGFGSGAAFAATPFLAMIVPPHIAVGLMLPLLMVMDVTSLRSYWRQWDWKNARAMMIGAIPGVIAGILIFRWADANMIRVLIGLIAVGYVLYELARRVGLLNVADRPFSPVFAHCAGLAAGFTSFVSHAGGPAAALQLLSQGLDKRTYQATTVLLFWWINLLKVGPFVALGLISRDLILAIAVLIPVAILGALMGVRIHNRLNDRWYFVLIYVFLSITGLRLIYVGLTN